MRNGYAYRFNQGVVSLKKVFGSILLCVLAGCSSTPYEFHQAEYSFKKDNGSEYTSKTWYRLDKKTGQMWRMMWSKDRKHYWLEVKEE
jgi:hypothetical protein